MAENKGCLFGSLTAATTHAGGDMLNLLNPEGEDLLVTRLILDVTTPATGAANVDAGIAASGTSNDALIDGADIGSAAIIVDSVDERVAATIPSAVVAWPHNQYLTVTPSASAAGLVGNYYVEYLRR